MRIGIDIDGVLYPWDEAARNALVGKFGGPRLGPSQSWDWLKESTSAAQWAWLWTAEGQDAAFGQVDLVYPDVVEAVRALLRNPRNRCHFVTHRDPRRTAGHTAAFLARHFGGHPWAGVHVVQNNVPKYALMEWDVFIDDKPSTVRELLDHTGALVFAPQRPWNTELYRIDSARFIHYSEPRAVSLLLGR